MKWIYGLLRLIGVGEIGANNRFLFYMMKKKRINNHLVNYKPYNEMQKMFLQYLPDRYSDNFSKYNQAPGFLDYRDIAQWTNGNYINNVGDITRFFALNLCIDQLIDEKINGDVAELGVFKGNSAVLLAKQARRTGNKCYLFDTFEGFDARDKPGESELVDNDFSDTSLTDVKNLVGEEQVIYVKGYFPESLTQTDELYDLALVHIDCDLEAPFNAALNHFYPRLKQGGFLIMHDYSSLYWPGAKRAIDNFFKDKAEFVIPIPDKSGTCIIRKI